ncbi:hypothetical protein D3C78_1151610 [compost metagenome]
MHRLIGFLRQAADISHDDDGGVGLQDFRDRLRQIGLPLRNEIGKRLQGAADIIKRLQQRLEIIAGFAGQQRHAAAAEAVIEKMHRTRRRDTFEGKAGEIVAQFEGRFHRRRRLGLAGREAGGAIGEDAALAVLRIHGQPRGFGGIQP